MSVVARVRANPQPLIADDARTLVAEHDALLDALGEAFQILGWYRQDHEDKAAEEGLPCVCDGCERFGAARRQYAVSLEPRPGYTALSEAYQAMKGACDSYREEALKAQAAERFCDALDEHGAPPHIQDWMREVGLMALFAAYQARTDVTDDGTKPT